MNEALIKKFEYIFSKYKVLYEGELLYFNYKTAKVRLETGEVIYGENINCKEGQGNEVFVARESEKKFYIFNLEDNETNKIIYDTLLRYRHTRPKKRKEEKIIKAGHLFSLTEYYNFEETIEDHAVKEPSRYYETKEVWQQELYTRKIVRVYDSLTEQVEGNVTKRFLLSGKANGGNLYIRHDIDEIYEFNPYHEIYVEIFRTDDDNFEFDDRYIDGSLGIYDFYKKFFLDEDRKFERIGGFKYHNGVINYDTKAVEMQQEQFGYSVDVSPVTGGLRVTRQTGNYSFYEMLPSFTDNFHIAVWDRSVGQQPDVALYGNYYDMGLPIQLREDPHTWHQMYVTISTQRIGLGGIENTKPYITDYRTYLPRFLEGVNVIKINNSNIEKEFIICFKKKSLIKGTDPSLSNLDELYIKDINLIDEINAPTQIQDWYKEINGGKLDYIYLSFLDEKWIEKQFTFTYPEVIENNIITKSIKNNIYNKSYFFNYLLNRGSGFHKFNSHLIGGYSKMDKLNSFHENLKLEQPFIKWLNSYLKAPDNIIGDFQTFVINGKKQNEMTIFNPPLDPSEGIYYGLLQYKLLIKEIFKKNPSLELNLFSNPSAIAEEKIIIPNFNNYRDILEEAGIEEWKRNNLNEKKPIDEIWEEFSLKLRYNNLDYIYLNNINIDNKEVVQYNQIKLLKTDLNNSLDKIEEILYLIFDITNSEDREKVQEILEFYKESYLLVLIFPFVEIF
jgi:hypothetical protein